MNSPLPSARQTQSSAHGEHVIRLAKQLADGHRAGVLATVGRDGVPHLRWMSTLTLQEFPHLYALTSPASRKVEQIRENSQVTWMFTNEASNMVINLSGIAKIVTDQNIINRIWRTIENKSNAFFLNLNADTTGIALIETLIENVECIVPRYDLHYSPLPDELAHLIKESACSNG